MIVGMVAGKHFPIGNYERYLIKLNCKSEYFRQLFLMSLNESWNNIQSQNAKIYGRLCATIEPVMFSPYPLGFVTCQRQASSQILSSPNSAVHSSSAAASEGSAYAAAISPANTQFDWVHARSSMVDGTSSSVSNLIGNCCATGHLQRSQHFQHRDSLHTSHSILSGRPNKNAAYLASTQVECSTARPQMP